MTDSNSPQSQSGPLLRDHKPLRIALAVLAALAIIMVLVMLRDLLGRYPKRESFHCGQLASPVLAMELARNKDDLKEVLQNDNPQQSLAEARKPENSDKPNAVCALRINTQQDCVFIPLYAGVLICLAWLFLYRAPKRLRWLGGVGVGFALVVAAYDYSENYGMFKALGASELTDELARAISRPSYMKWSLLGVTLLLLAVMIGISRFADLRRWAKWLLAAAFTGSGGMMLLALFHLPLFFWANGAFAGALVISSAGLLGPFLTRLARAKAAQRI